MDDAEAHEELLELLTCHRSEPGLYVYIYIYRKTSVFKYDVSHTRSGITVLENLDELWQCCPKKTTFEIGYNC